MRTNYSSNKELKQMISAELKKAGIPKEWKTSLSVRDCRYVRFSIKAAPVDLLKKINEKNARRYYLDGYGQATPLNHVQMNHVGIEDFDGETYEIMHKIVLALNAFNYDNSDSQVDYFDCGYYANIHIGEIGEPFQVTGAPSTQESEPAQEEIEPVQEDSEPVQEENTAINEYEAKQAAKRARYAELAEKARKESDARISHASKMSAMIPAGQPILVDHYSAKGHRRALDKISNNMRKGIELHKKAEHYARKAESEPYAISSDDPDAIGKIQDRIDELKGRRGKAPEIRRLKARIATLESQAKLETRDHDHGWFQVREDAKERRIMFFFEGRPDEETRAILKHRAFKWSPSRGAWVRQWTGNAVWAAQDVIKALLEETL